MLYYKLRRFFCPKGRHSASYRGHFMFRSLMTKRFRLFSTPVFLLSLGLLWGLADTLHCRAQQTVSPTTNQGRRITLRDQLVTGLRAFTKSDLQFIDSVVLAVEQGRLPRRIVDGTFLWARDRAVRHSYRRRLRPMVYFRPAMVARAARLRVAL